MSDKKVLQKIGMTIIAAVARNGVIGVNGDMPWRIPSDFAHFRRMTMGKPMVMGRKQYETLGRPLPGRTNIVVSRQKGYQPDGVIVINDFEGALDHARSIAIADGVDQVMVIGGGEIYEMAMDVAGQMIISHVEMDVRFGEGDRVTRFPEIDPARWRLKRELPVFADVNDQAEYSIKVYLSANANVH